MDTGVITGYVAASDVAEAEQQVCARLTEYLHKNPLGDDSARINALIVRPRHSPDRFVFRVDVAVSAFLRDDQGLNWLRDLKDAMNTDTATLTVVGAAPIVYALPDL